MDGGPCLRDRRRSSFKTASEHTSDGGQQMMDIRKLAAALVVISFLASIVLSATVYAAGDAPVFFVNEKNVDLGNFYEGVDILYDFTIQNKGVGELHLTSVKPG